MQTWSGGLRIKIPVHFETDMLVIDWEPFAVLNFIHTSVVFNRPDRPEYNGIGLTVRCALTHFIKNKQINKQKTIYTYSVSKTLAKVHCCLCVWYGVLWTKHQPPYLILLGHVIRGYCDDQCSTHRFFSPFLHYK